MKTFRYIFPRLIFVLALVACLLFVVFRPTSPENPATQTPTVTQTLSTPPGSPTVTGTATFTPTATQEPATATLEASSTPTQTGTATFTPTATQEPATATPTARSEISTPRQKIERLEKYKKCFIHPSGQLFCRWKR